MQLNKVFKGLLIALPVVTMMACSTTPKGPTEAEIKEQAEVQRQQDAETAAAAEAKALAAARDADEMKNREMRRQLETLQQDQVVYLYFDTANMNSSAL